jgi:hypothetical protein
MMLNAARVYHIDVLVKGFDLQTQINIFTAVDVLLVEATNCDEICSANQAARPGDGKNAAARTRGTWWQDADVFDFRQVGDFYARMVDRIVGCAKLDVPDESSVRGGGA